MPRIPLPVIALASAACSSTLGLNDVTRGDAGTGELDRIAALEQQVAAMKASQDATLAALEPIALRASLATAQSVPGVGAAGTIVLFDQIDRDTHHKYDAATGKYAIPVRGEYVVVAVLGYDEMNKARANCEIWVDTPAAPNGRSLTAVTTPANASGTGAQLVRVTCTAIAQLDAGDRVYVKAFDDLGAPTPLITEARSTNFEIIRIPGLAP